MMMMMMMLFLQLRLPRLLVRAVLQLMSQVSISDSTISTNSPAPVPAHFHYIIISLYHYRLLFTSLYHYRLLSPPTHASCIPESPLTCASSPRRDIKSYSESAMASSFSDMAMRGCTEAARCHICEAASASRSRSTRSFSLASCSPFSPPCAFAPPAPAPRLAPGGAR